MIIHVGISVSIHAEQIFFFAIEWHDVQISSIKISIFGGMRTVIRRIIYNRGTVEDSVLESDFIQSLYRSIDLIPCVFDSCCIEVYSEWL